MTPEARRQIVRDHRTAVIAPIRPDPYATGTGAVSEVGTLVGALPTHLL